MTASYSRRVEASEVAELYADLVHHDIPIWIDGGWCVDALVGRQTRSHNDLDVAVRRPHAGELCSYLTARGFAAEESSESQEWVFVMANADGDRIDIHVFDYDGETVSYGIEYPYGALTGVGTIAGRDVNCVSAEWMFRFKTAYEPKPKDLDDVAALAEAFGFDVPESHRG